MSRILVVAERHHDRLTEGTRKALACASKLSPDGADLAVLGAGAEAAAAEGARFAGVARVRLGSQAGFDPPLASVWAPVLARLAADYEAVLMPASSLGRDLLPRASALAGGVMITEVAEVLDARTFRRFIYAGNVCLTVRVRPEAGRLFLTVRLASWPTVEERDGGEAPVVRDVPDPVADPATRYVGLEEHASERPDLQSAKRVVSGGRGLGSAENFTLLERLAERLGAAVGASRAAVDAGYAPNDLQVGQTGKIIAPDLYMAFGISGAIQHVTGIKDARVIVAVNKDPEAPIFKIADVGLVGDLFAIIPELEKALERAGVGS
jgi:electron transfer flavoprotein alpha subunit